jgi:type II secretory ATPase GspE/PulE/Tfp pilus assembly ATPase PilB-like protein
MNLSMMQLNHKQQKVFHSIIENPQGLHVLTSTYGSGKTFFVKYITRHFQTLGKKYCYQQLQAHKHFVCAPL